MASPASDHTSNPFYTSAFNAGETVNIGQVVYLDGSSVWKLALATAVSTSEGLIGIALESKTVGQAMKVALPGSFVRDDSWSWTPNNPLYVSRSTAGSMTATQPTTKNDVIRLVAYAVTATVVFVFPQMYFTRR